MRKRLLNRLWVRFSLAIIGIVFAITVLPAASLLLVEPEDWLAESTSFIESINAEAALALSAGQINVLAENLAAVIEQAVYDDTQFLLVTTLIVGVVAGALLGRGLSLPIERLVAATKAVGSRNLSYQVPVKGAQEMQDLAHNFNQMTAELARSEQLRRNMMADVSHELLTPLTVLQGNLRAMLDDVYELNKEEIGTLYAQNKHLIHLVQDLRQLAQAEAGKLPFQKTAVNLADLAAETITFFMPTTEEKQITVVRDLAKDLPPLQADADRLRQVLHNLMGNAIRHTPAGGHITVQAQPAGAEIRLSIANTGDGIAPERLPHVFDRFYRTEGGRRRDAGGAGLGLAISKAIVEAHNGRIAATSPGQDQGTTFTIHFPTNVTPHTQTRVEHAGRGAA